MRTSFRKHNSLFTFITLNGKFFGPQKPSKNLTQDNKKNKYGDIF